LFASGSHGKSEHNRCEQGVDIVSRSLSYWKKVVPDLELTQALRSDYASGTQSFAGHELITTLERSSVKKSLEQLSGESVTPFHFLLAAYSIALFRTFAYDRQAIGFTTTLRPDGFEDALGCYITVLPCLIHVSKCPTYSHLLCRVRHSLWKTIENGRVPFEGILNQLRAQGLARNFRGFQTFIGFDDSPLDHLKLQALEIRPHRVHSASTKFPLALNVEVSSSKFVLSFEYRPALYRESSIRLLVRTFLSELDQLAHAGYRKLS
jgi:non-ribosomal peptide synthetase component F